MRIRYAHSMIFLGLALFAASACKSSRSSEGADSAPSEAADRPPKAPPADEVAKGEGDEGPEAEGEAKPCASSEDCPKGHYCTVETGDCDRPPGCGPEDICPQVCYGVCEAGAPPEAGAACESDGDCRTFSDYCGGCACRALAAGAPDPRCGGDLVNCVTDPCGEERAVCRDGACVLAREDEVR